MKPLPFAALALLLAGAAHADTGHPAMMMPMDHAAMAMPKSPAAADAMSEGVIRKLDAAAGQCTIQHGPLRNLGMGPMTMVFHAKEPGMLKGYKVGDRIGFVADRVGGRFILLSVKHAE